jgi:phosphoribosylaminoimidazole-succinocarboxamide synthase
VIQEQGHVALEARCAGVKKGAPATDNVNVQGTDLPSVQSTLRAKLQQDKNIDYIVTLGAPFALVAMQAVKEAGSQAKVVTFDLNADAAKAIQDGKIEFAIDQQPYVQGHEAIDALWLWPDQRQRHRRWPAGSDRSLLRRQVEHREDRRVREQRHALSHVGERVPASHASAGTSSPSRSTHPSGARP